MNLYLKKESAGKSAAAGLNEKDPVWRGSLAAEHLSAKANERGQLPFACSGRATCEHKHMCGWVASAPTAWCSAGLGMKS